MKFESDLGLRSLKNVVCSLNRPWCAARVLIAGCQVLAASNMV